MEVITVIERKTATVPRFLLHLREEKRKKEEKVGGAALIETVVKFQPPDFTSLPPPFPTTTSIHQTERSRLGIRAPKM